jgi:hypothetical protein
MPQLAGETGEPLAPHAATVDPLCVHELSGEASPGSPARVQSVARGAEMMPDHACPYENVGNKSNIEIRGKKCVQWRLIYLPVLGQRSLASSRTLGTFAAVLPQPTEYEPYYGDT